MANLDIRIESDLRRAVAELQVRVDSKARAAASRAINRSLTGARTEAVQLLRKDYPGLKVRALRARIRIVRATRRELTGALVFSGKRFGYWGNFPVRTVQTKYGTGVRPAAKLPFGLQTVDGLTVGPEQLRSAFVQRGRNHKRPAVWLRVGTRSLPIEAIVALGVSRAFVERRIGQVLTRSLRARFNARLQRELKFEQGQR